MRTGLRQCRIEAVSSGPRTEVGQRGEDGWQDPVGRWERSGDSAPAGWWPGTLLSYWRCTEKREGRHRRREGAQERKTMSREEDKTDRGKRDKKKTRKP